MTQHQPESSIVPQATRDRPTVGAAGERIDITIAGVEVRRLGPIHLDHRGSLVEVIDTQDSFWRDPIVYAYRFTISPGRIKGWGMHKLQTDRYVLAAGRIRVALFDGRTDSPTFEVVNQVFFGDEAPGLLSIPPGVWHADQNIGATEAAVINFPTRAFDRANPDKYRLDPHGSAIPFDFTLRDG
jgi:dTDP-4-dehydrorhamnose 3,5-epimerase